MAPFLLTAGVIMFTVLAWFVLDTARQTWRRSRKHLFRLRLSTFFVVTAAVCLLSLITRGMAMQRFVLGDVAGFAICYAVLFPLCLGAAFFVELVIGDVWEALSGRDAQYLARFREDHQEPPQVDDEQNLVVPPDRDSKNQESHSLRHHWHKIAPQGSPLHVRR